MHQSIHQATIKGLAGESPGTFTLIRYTSGDAIKKALKVLLCVWLVAGMAIFVPIVHFFLVPIGVLAGPVIAMLSYRKILGKEAITDGTSTCPSCKEPIRFAFDRPRGPLHGVCLKCGAGHDLLWSLRPTDRY